MIAQTTSPVSPIVLARRVGRIGQSATNAMTQKARELTSKGRNIIALTVGEPDFDTPDFVVEAAMNAMRSGQTRYTDVSGTKELKSAIARKFQRDNDLKYAPNQIIVGTGAKQVVFNALLATVEAGDEVIIPAPYWVSYPEITRLAGGVPRILQCDSKSGFKFAIDQLEGMITPSTKWLILNSPCNPTGAILSESELQAIASILMRHPRVHVLTDDIYEHLRYSREPYATIAQVAPALLERTLTVNGVSKAYAMTGWRIGYGAGPAALIKAMGNLQSQSTSSPNAMAQAAAAAALDGEQGFIQQQVAAYRERRGLALAILRQCARIEATPPAGAFYIYVKCDAVIGLLTATGKAIETDEDLALYLLEEWGVGVVHGRAFGCSPAFRISIAASSELVAEGCKRIVAAIAALTHPDCK